MNIENPVLVITPKRGSGQPIALIVESQVLKSEKKLIEKIDQTVGYERWINFEIGVGTHFVCQDPDNVQKDRVQSMKYFLDNYRIDFVSDGKTLIEKLDM